MIPESLQLSKLAQAFKPGIYQHYKGEQYHAMFVAKHSEHHDDELVIYQSINDKYICARPLTMFLENVEWDGKITPRFKWIKEME